MGTVIPEFLGMKKPVIPNPSYSIISIKCRPLDRNLGCMSHCVEAVLKLLLSVCDAVFVSGVLSV